MVHIKKYLIAFCLTGALAFAPVSQANARYHHGNTIAAAAIGGAVAGLVGAVVQDVLSPSSRTVVVEQPTYVVEEPVYIEPEPVVVAPVVVHRPHRYYRPVHPIRHVRHHYRYY